MCKHSLSFFSKATFPGCSEGERGILPVLGKQVTEPAGPRHPARSQAPGQPGSQATRQPGSQAARSQAPGQQASQPATQSGHRQPPSQAASQPGNQPGSLSARQAARQLLYRTQPSDVIKNNFL